MEDNMKAIFFGNLDGDGKPLLFLRQHMEVYDLMGRWGYSFPESAFWWKGDLCISYNSRWIIPASILNNIKIAINFHPGPPEYPGVGCVNWALYEGATRFGVTCHFMDKTVDSGGIIRTIHFPVYPNDTVESLLQRTRHAQLALFYDVMEDILSGIPLYANSFLSWTGPPQTRKQLDELARIDCSMDDVEVARRVRATSYGPWQPTIKLGGFTFENKS